MSQMRFQAAFLGAVALASAATAALAQEKLNKADKNWMDNEVGAIITAQEKATFQEINKDDRKLFKDLFWMRRDFNPMTSENEYQREFQARVKAADENFKGRGQKGSQSDPGKIFLLLGGPSRQQRGSREAAGGGASDSSASPTTGADPGTGEDPGGASTPGLSDFGGGGGENQFLTWVYDPNPDLGIPNGLTVQFRQQNEFGYRLVSSDDLQKQLERAKERLVSNPTVSYARDENGRLRKADAKFDPNSPAKLALKALKETGTTSDGISFDVTPAFFRSTEGTIYIPLDLVVKSGLATETGTVFGAVDNADGFTIQQFEEKATFTKMDGGQSRWEIPLLVQPGLYTLYIGVMDESGQTMGTRVADLDVPDFYVGDLTLSSVLLFTNAERTGEAMGAFGKAFMFGGYHFSPKLEPKYTQADQLEGVLYAYNYGIEGEKPNLTLEVQFSKGGEGRGRAPATPFIVQSPEMSLHIFGYGLNINNFKEPGDYKMTLKITDHVKGTTVTKEIPFVMVAQ